MTLLHKCWNKQYNNSIYRHGNDYLTSKTASEKRVLFIFIVIEDNKSNVETTKKLQSNFQKIFLGKLFVQIRSHLASIARK